MSTELISDLVALKGHALLRVSVLENLFDEDPEVAFFLKDAEGRYLSVNGSLAERHGFAKKEDMLGKRPVDVCPGSFGEVPTEQDNQVLTTGEALVNHLEMHWIRPHHPCWCLTTKLPLRDGEEIVGLVGFSRDLKEEVPLEEIPPKLALALESFEKDCGAASSPSSLAEAAGLSLSQFARLMKRFFGVTPSQYISRSRIKAATRRLTESDDSVADIALDCGFSDHSAFSRAFRAATGLTPTQFREELKDDQKGPFSG